MRTVTINNREYVAINKIAHLVTNIHEEYKPNINHNRKHFSTPPTSHPIPKNKTNLINTKRGNMIIFSYMGDDKWLAKCVCGEYEIRNGEKWRRGLREKTKDHGCVYCQQQFYRNKLIQN